MSVYPKKFWCNCLTTMVVSAFAFWVIAAGYFLFAEDALERSSSVQQDIGSMGIVILLGFIPIALTWAVVAALLGLMLHSSSGMPRVKSAIAMGLGGGIGFLVLQRFSTGLDRAFGVDTSGVSTLHTLVVTGATMLIIGIAFVVWTWNQSS